MKRPLTVTAWCLSLLLCLWLLMPAPAQAQLLNALTRASLQAQNFVMMGSWDFTGHMKLRRASTAPTGNTIGDFYFNTVSNNWWYTAANGTWTTVAAGNFANPYTPNQAFSGIVDFTGTVNLPRQQTIEVCKAGCGFSTVTAALASISDNSVTKRYQLIVHPGDYDENFSAISYTTVRCQNRNTTRLRGASATTITWAAGITEFGIDNCTIGGVTPIGATTAEGSRVVLRISNSVLGIIDGTESSSGKTTTCLLDTGAKHDIYVENVECRSRLDGYRVATDAGLFLTGGRVDLDDKGTASTCMRGLSASDTGAQIIATAVNFGMVKSATGCLTGGRSGSTAIEYDIDTNGGTRPTLITLSGGSIVGSITGTPTGNNMACMNLGNAISAQQSNSRVEYLGTDCDLNGGASSWTMRGIYQSSSDTDWANVAVRWVGGNIRLIGSFIQDMNRSTAIAGQSIELMAVGHAGNYTGVLPTVANLYSTVIPVGQVKTVCKSGCQYTLISDAMNSITDAAETKRYIVKVGSGVYDETVTPKSYVGIDCMDPYSSQINSSVGQEIVFPAAQIKSFSINNCMLGAYVPIGYGALLAGSYFEISNCVIGRDTEDANDHSVDGFANLGGSGAAITIISRNNHFKSEFDFWKIGAGDTIYDSNSTYEVVGNTAATPIRVFAFSSNPFSGTGDDGEMGAQVVVTNPTIIGDVSGFPAGAYVFHADPPSVETAIRAARFLMVGGTVDWYTVGAGTGAIEFVHAGAAFPNANGVEVSILGTAVRFRDPGGTRTMAGVSIGTDADHSTWKIRWLGGSLDMSGGGTINDVVSSETTGGFLFEMAGVRHAGTYSGTAPPTTIDTRMGKFGYSLQGPVTAGAAPTASGFLAYDSTANDLEYGDNGTNRKVANLDEAQTFTNKTLTAPIIATISNTGTLTLPTSTDTLVGKATSDTLTNKTLTSPLLTLADLVVGTCTAGQLGIDNGGATKEWCVCGTTNTWGCWKLTDGTFNANGPAD